MPSPKSQRRLQDRKGRFVSERSSSFHGHVSPSTTTATPQLRRPKTVPDMMMYRKEVVGGTMSPEVRPKLTKLLLNVTIQGSVGAVQVVMSGESTVDDLVATAVRQYEKEGRRPILPSNDPARFDLHYSQFSLESLDREEKLMTLGSRNFFLCPQKATVDGGSCGGAAAAGSCSKEAVKASKQGSLGSSLWTIFCDNRKQPSLPS